MITENAIACPLCDTPSPVSECGKTPAFHCPACRLVSLGDVQPPEGYYEDYFDRFRSERNAPAAVLRDRQYRIDARHLASYQPRGRVLDVGCSAGGFLEALDQTGAAFTHFTGIDPDRSAIARCRELRLSTQHDFAVGDVLEAPLAHDRYAAVVFRGTLQYVGLDLKRVLGRVDGLLEDGGYVFLYALPNADSFLFHLLADRWHLFHPLEHRLVFNASSMRAIAARMGWELVEVSYPYLDTPYASPATDYARVLDMVRGGSPGPVAFWGNLMQVVLRAGSGAARIGEGGT